MPPGQPYPPLPPQSPRVAPPYPVPPPRTRADLPSSGPGAPGRISGRFLARILDTLLISFVPAVILVQPYIPTDPAAQIDLSKIPVWVLVVLSVLPAVYEFVCYGAWGLTAGKRVMGLRVARYSDGDRPTWNQAAIRVLVPLAPAAVGFAVTAVAQMMSILQIAVYLWAVVDPLLRGLHDRAAGTIVLRTR